MLNHNNFHVVICFAEQEEVFSGAALDRVKHSESISALMTRIHNNVHIIHKVSCQITFACMTEAERGFMAKSILIGW